MNPYTITTTHHWRAPSGVLVQSCVPVHDTRGFARLLVASWTYAFKKYMLGNW